MKNKLLSLALAGFVLIDHLIWFYTGFAGYVSIPYVAGSEVFRTVVLVFAFASLRRPWLHYTAQRAVSVYAFGFGGLVASAYSLAFSQSPSLREFLGFWRPGVEPPLSAYLVALSCVGYLVVCSFLLPRSRNL